MYRENDWVYVIGHDTRQEGFIPHSYCTPYNSHLAELAIKKKLPRDPQVGPNEVSDTNNEWWVFYFTYRRNLFAKGNINIFLLMGPLLFIVYVNDFLSHEIL